MPRWPKKETISGDDFQVVETPVSPNVSPRESLQNQLEALNDLRTSMQTFGIDSMSKLDALAGILIAELAKL